MRERLFRGIPKSDIERYAFGNIWKDNCDGSFVYGSLVVNKDRYYICVSAMCKINCCINNGMTSMIEVIPESVSEFTGITDKNGNKIFEGDIVKVESQLFGSPFWVGKVGKVVYEECSYFIEPKNPMESEYLFADECADFEIIGNIHDNPELLKEGEADA